MRNNALELLWETDYIPSQGIHLRRFRDDDADAVLAYGSDEETLRYIFWPGVSTREGALETIRGYYSEMPGVFAIARNADALCLGCMDLRLDLDNEKGTIAYMLDRAHWGQGIISHAVGLILRLAFEKLELNRVEATHSTMNPASGRVMEKNGMLFEGTGREEMKAKGVFHDIRHYGMLRRDWRNPPGNK